MIDAYRRGQLAWKDWAWTSGPPLAGGPVCLPPPWHQPPSAADDLEPYVPGSFDDVLAYDFGKLSDAEYEFLAEAVSVSVPGPG